MAEYMNTRMDEDGEIVAVMVSKVGGGTVGKAYTGYWKARIIWDGATVWETGLGVFDQIFTGSHKTHEDVVDIAMDFYTNGGPF